MQPRSLLTTLPLLALVAACEGTFVIDPSDPRLDLTVAAVPKEAGTPLIFLNGTRISMTELRELDQDRIASIEIVKGAAATSLYGAEGRDGAIHIALKR
jgi:hypothetical protein